MPALPNSLFAGARRIVALARCWPPCLALVLSTGLAPMARAQLWFDAGRPVAEARQAVAILATAAEDGLEADDYDAPALRAAVDHAEAEALPAEEVASLDVALTAAMQRYLAHLHFGRIDPRQIHQKFSVKRAGRFDPAAYLRMAVAEHRLAEAVREAAPSVPFYAGLREALGHYRELAGNSSWHTPLPSLPKRKLEAGQAYAGLAVLTRRLVALGDLPVGSAPGQRYQGALVEGIKAFQMRHGLRPDGVIGKGTFEQLNVTPAERVRQIELTLERLRWTPLSQSSRMIVVNVPEFMLRAYALSDGRPEVAVAMKVIVGKALDTRTPLFDEEMRYIEFSPYWNIPPSIARDETVPRLRREPGYFQRQGMELVTASGSVINGLSDELLDAVLRGELRIRQRPGPQNPLGDIKFVFPNNDNIYLHHTPSVRLFERERRDFSHGCIRVEEPVALAKFVLQNQPEWTEERIRAAMSKGKSATLRLKEPVPVVIAYTTAIVETDGKVHFFPDIYGHDRLLDDALRQRSPQAVRGESL